MDILGAFVNLRKTTIGFVMCECPAVRFSAWNNSAPTGQIILKFHTGLFFENMLRKFDFIWNGIHIVSDTNCDCYTVWQPYRVTTAQGESYTVWLLHSVTATQSDSYTVWHIQCDSYIIHHAVCIRLNKLTGVSKINKFHNCVSLPNIFCTVTCIKSRPVITALKFHKQFLMYITRHSELYVLYFVTLISYYFFHPALICLFYSLLISYLVLKCLKVEVRLRGWIFDRTGGWV